MRRPDLDTVYSVNPDGSRNFIHTADVRGRWQVRKKVIHWVALAIFFLLPWLVVGGHPAIHIDLPGRQAFIFGQTFTNQDFYLTFFLVTGLGFTLFVVTALWGRIWCGYACPQTLLVDGVFRRVERLIEGSRERRLRRDAGPVNWAKIWRKIVKHTLYFALSGLAAHTFTSYFFPIRELLPTVFSGPTGHTTAFVWTLVWTGILYFDYAWFREQTCIVICPYGRLQSALTDTDTVVIGYDEKRGEPRGKKGADGAADCIDCFRCVTVCPTGIDIRNGLQLECIGCANCIDACDEVMDKLERPRGLIRYDSQRGLEEGERRSLRRPRTFLYAALGLLGVVVFSWALLGRETFEARILRPRGLPYQLTEETIRNLYSVKLQNKSDVVTDYAIRVELPSPEDGGSANLERLEIVVAREVATVQALQDVEIPVFLTLPRADYDTHFPFTIVVQDQLSGKEKELELRFRGP